MRSAAEQPLQPSKSLVPLPVYTASACRALADYSVIAAEPMAAFQERESTAERPVCWRRQIFYVRLNVLHSASLINLG
jgi:hypothetical protein